MDRLRGEHEAYVSFRGPRFLQDKIRGSPATNKDTSDGRQVVSAESTKNSNASQPSPPAKTPARNAKVKNRLECVIAPPIARITAILQIFRKGMAMDSSHRNKVAFNSPVTMLTTLNEQHHMVPRQYRLTPFLETKLIAPVAAMVSAHADTAAYAYLLTEFEKATKETAEQVIKGEYRPDVEGVSHSDLVRQCKIFLEEGLSPRFVMIDRSDAERVAIRTVMPGCPIRVCQFHMMQACRSKLRKIFGRYPNRDVLAEQTLEDIRACQRCDEKDNWDSCYQELANAVRERIPDDQEAWKLLDKYLKDEWFCERWADAVIDYALPIEVSRDGPWSTNNYTEACFRTFDRVFLVCRVNRRFALLLHRDRVADLHRLDRLLLVIIEAFFPFYETFSTGPPRPDPQFQNQLFGGLHRWEAGCIHPCPIESVPVAHRNKFGSHIYCVFPAKRQSAQSLTQFCGRKPNGREVCTCHYPANSGKRCIHLWAMITYELLGSVNDFEENSAIIESHLRAHSIGSVPEWRKNKSGRTGSRMPPEVEDDEADFEGFWGKKVEDAAQILLDPDPRMFPSVPLGPPRSPSPSCDSDSDDSPQDAVLRLNFPAVPTHVPGLETPSTQTTSSSSKRAIDLTPPSPITPSSPIRRRFRSPRTASPIEEQLHDGTDHAHGNSGSLLSAVPDAHVGAPAKIRPLHPHRSSKTRTATPYPQSRKVDAVKPQTPGHQSASPSESPSFTAESGSSGGDPESPTPGAVSATNARRAKRKTSSLALPREAKRQIAAMRPIGVVNTGLDCYIISLIQIIVHVDTWSNALFSDWVREKLSTVPEYTILANLRDSLQGTHAVAFSDLRRVLSGMSLRIDRV